MRNSGRIPDTLREGTVQASSPAEVTVLLARARADNLRREAGKDWVAKLAGGNA